MSEKGLLISKDDLDNIIIIDEQKLKEDISLILGYVTVQQEMYPLSKKQYDAKKRLREYVLKFKKSDIYYLKKRRIWNE